MTEDQEGQSGRARERAAASARKKAKLAWSQSSFDLLAAGYSPEQIADVRKRPDDPARNRRRRRPAPARRARALCPSAGREAHQGAALCGCGA
jgi:hypothetical protein